MDWRHWVAAARHPARKDGAIAMALVVLPWVIALALELLHHPGVTAVTILASASVGLPAVWLAWVPIRNASRSGALSGGDRASGTAVLAGAGAGRPLAEVTDPFALEVHQPVQPEDLPPGLSVLPAYVPREHDMRLGSVVQAAAGGRSGIAVLVGGSSTGKTRACWETLQLVRAQPEPWRVWHPIDPTRPDAALRELPGIGPRTVVWLNEAQFYLDVADGGLGERVAAGLRELLRDPDRAPVLVLATLWPQFWDTLTARPPDGADPHAQARELLAGHDITVPAGFTQAQLDQLARAGDARLTLAATGAQDGQVIQFLAGAPELLARYRNAPPAAAALINAAMDARRLGLGIGMPQGFLAAAAPGYLTGADWGVLGENWENVLQEAWDYAAIPCKGVPGPLTRSPPARPAMTHPARPGSPDADDQPPAGQVHRDDGPLYGSPTTWTSTAARTAKTGSPRPGSGPRRQPTPLPVTSPRSGMQPTTAACIATLSSFTRTPQHRVTSAPLLTSAIFRPAFAAIPAPRLGPPPTYPSTTRPAWPCCCASCGRHRNAAEDTGRAGREGHSGSCSARLRGPGKGTQARAILHEARAAPGGYLHARDPWSSTSAHLSQVFGWRTVEDARSTSAGGALTSHFGVARPVAHVDRTLA
jgi:hypothetical protein